MCYTMKRQQQHFIQSLREHRTSPFPNMDRDGNVKMTEHRIYIGLNDTETREQKFETERYLETIKRYAETIKRRFLWTLKKAAIITRMVNTRRKHPLCWC